MRGTGYLKLGICAILFVWVLWADSARAQVGYAFEAGYVVTADGDSLRGTIAALPEVLATREVRFRPEGQRRVVRYAPEALRTAGTDAGRRYEAVRLVPGQGEPEQMLLLQHLVKGPVSLYAYSYDDRSTVEERRRVVYRPDRFAVRTEAGEMLPLYVRVEQRSAVGENGPPQLWGVQQYVSRLGQAFVACEDVRSGVEAVPFRREALTEAVVAYNDCVGGRSRVAQESAVRTRRRMGPIAIRAGSGLYTLQEQERDVSGQGVLSSVGVHVIVTPVPALPQLTFPLEVNISASRIDRAWTTMVYNGDDFSRTRLGVLVGARYAFPMARMGPFVGVGGQVTYAPEGQERFIPFPQPGAGTYRLPKREVGGYAEAGVFGIGGWQQRFGVGLRYDASVQSALRPGGRGRTTWEGQAFSGFLIVLL